MFGWGRWIHGVLELLKEGRAVVGEWLINREVNPRSHLVIFAAMFHSIKHIFFWLPGAGDC